MFTNVEFNLGADQVMFSTQTNGDAIRIKSLELNAEQAARLAYLINQPDPLKVEIKIDTP